MSFPLEASGFHLQYLSPAVRSGTFNLVFAGLNYPDRGSFLKDLAGLEGRLRLTEPFDAFQDSLRISYLELDQKEEAAFFKNAGGAPGLKVRMDLLRRISGLTGLYKLVIIDYRAAASSAELSSIRRTSLIVLGRGRSSNGGDFAKAFLHELGHSLGLRDECLLCARREPGLPNCAPDKESAQKWWGRSVEYVNGCCGSKEYFRPTVASLMNDPRKASDYGFINQEYLRRELSEFLSGARPPGERRAGR